MSTSGSSSASVRDRVALITGASAGMGRDTALYLAKQGAKVVVFARRKERLDKLVEEIKAAGGEAIAVVGDVSSKADNQAAVDAAVSTFGGLDIAFLNAGVYRGGASLPEVSDADIDSILNINVKGVIYGMQTALPKLQESKNDPSLIVTSSIMGSHFQAMSSGSALYSASKAAVNSLVQTAAIENAGKVRVNAILPGITKTDILVGMTPEQIDGFAASASLIPRAGDGEEIATLVEFLAATGKYITGSLIEVDGGWKLK
jgi:NAD(P)-dependent dehydrogenase (short-subunit alcohol dehydrogenase family)